MLYPSPPRRPGSPRPLWTAACCAAAFAALAVAVGAHPGPVAGVETATHLWSVAHRPAAGVRLARVITDTGTWPWPWLAVAAAGAAVGRSAVQRLRAALAFLGVLASGQVVRALVMEAVARPRPGRADWAASASGFSFPSGHATTSAITAGLLCWALARGGRPADAWWGRAVPVGWAVGVGLTRVYLGVHWNGDVLGGWLLAGFWVAATACLLPAAIGRSPAEGRRRPGGTRRPGGSRPEKPEPPGRPACRRRAVRPAGREPAPGWAVPLAVAVTAAAVVAAVTLPEQDGVRVTGRVAGGHPRPCAAASRAPGPARRHPGRECRPTP